MKINLLDYHQMLKFVDLLLKKLRFFRKTRRKASGSRLLLLITVCAVFCHIC